MGMTILQAKQKLHESWMLLTTCGRDTELTQALSIAETVLGNYDDALKADMVAMLTDTKDALKHCEITGLWKANYREGFNDGVSKSLDAIQEKINKLKEIKNE